MRDRNGTLIVLIASGFGSGNAPRAPGTFGSLAAVMTWLTVSYLLVPAQCSQVAVNGLFTGACTLLGFVVVSKVVRGTSSKDPQWIVIDEWAGMGTALLLTSYTQWVEVVFAFGLFRFFDASKVGLVGRAERLPGAIGVMADDVVAGFFTLFVLEATKLLYATRLFW